MQRLLLFCLSTFILFSHWSCQTTSYEFEEIPALEEVLDAGQRTLSPNPNASIDYFLSRDIILRDTLRVKPGTRITVSERGFIQIEAGGALIVEGTANEPVELIAQVGSRIWRGIVVSGDGLLDVQYLHLTNAERIGLRPGSKFRANSSYFKHSTESSFGFIEVEATSQILDSLSGNTFEGISYPFRFFADGLANMDRMVPNNTYLASAGMSERPAALISGNLRIDYPLYFAAAGLDYELSDELLLWRTLEIEPGVRIRGDERIRVDPTTASQGKIIAKGTAETPIVFDGVQLFMATPNNELEHVEMRGTSLPRAMIYIWRSQSGGSFNYISFEPRSDECAFGFYNLASPQNSSINNIDFGSVPSNRQYCY